MKQLSRYKETFHRALSKSPKRIVMSGEHPMSFVEKMKGLIHKTPLTSWIFFGSLGFLLFALGYASNPNKGNIGANLMHTVGEIIQDTEGKTTAQEDNRTDEDKQIEQIVDALLVSNNEKNDTTSSVPKKLETIQLVHGLVASINDGSYAIGDFFDTYMKTSKLVQSYFTSAKLAKFRASLVGDIVIKNAKEFPTDRKDRVGVNYTIAYTLATTQQVFEETRSVTLRPQSGGWRIGIFRCESKGCSVNPFFNPEKYDIK